MQAEHSGFTSWFPAWGSDVPEHIHNHSMHRKNSAKEKRASALKQLKHISWRIFQAGVQERVKRWREESFTRDEDNDISHDDEYDDNQDDEEKSNRDMVTPASAIQNEYRIDQEMNQGNLSTVTRKMNASPTMKVYALRQLQRLQVSDVAQIQNALHRWKEATLQNIVKKYYRTIKQMKQIKEESKKRQGLYGAENEYQHDEKVNQP